MDNAKAHALNPLQKVLGQNGVMSVTYAPHATNIFQMPDVSLFGVFKILEMLRNKNLLRNKSVVS
jgi:hypothetical protein